jgi:hypothetical protein
MERLRLCKSFDELRTLLQVEVRGCAVCGGKHRGTLVEKTSKRVPLSPTNIDWVICWIVTPRPECAKVVDRALGVKPEWVVTPVAVEQGRVFIIEDFEEQSTSTNRKLERVE